MVDLFGVQAIMEIARVLTKVVTGATVIENDLVTGEIARYMDCHPNQCKGHVFYLLVYHIDLVHVDLFLVPC